MSEYRHARAVLFPGGGMMKKATTILGTCILALTLAWARAGALTVLSFSGELAQWGTFSDDRAGKKTQITYEKSTDEKLGDVLKVKYFLDKESWCGIYHHSLNQKWLGIRTLNIQARGTQDSMIRVSFLDINKVSWVYDLKLTSEWNKYEVPIGEFKKNPYYQPPEAKTDKPMNVSLITQVQFEPQTAGNGILYVAQVDAAGVVEKLNEENGIGPRSTAGQIVFDNLESKKQVGAYKYADEKAGASIATLLKKRAANKYMLQGVYNSGTGDYGCGFGFASSPAAAAAGNTSAAFNAKGRTQLLVQAKFPRGAKFRVSVNEADESDGEKWTSPWQTGTGQWGKYLLPLRAFEKNIYVGNQDGNNQLDIATLKTVEFEIGPSQGTGEFLLDSVVFK
jgi:hypothetical protein